MNLDQIIARTRTVLRDSAGLLITDANIVDWSNEAQLDLQARIKILTASTTGTTSGNTIALPYNLLEATSLRIGTTDYRFVDEDTWWSWSDAGLTPNEPIARVFADAIELYPTPATGSTYSLRFFRKPSRMIVGETAAPVATSSGSAAAEIATINTAAPHGLAVGDIVDVVGVTPTAYNGRWYVLTVPDTDTFTAHIGSTPAAISVQGTVELTDEPELPEELHIRIVNYARYHAKLLLGEVAEAEQYLVLYERDLPPNSLAHSRIQPGPISVIVDPGPFDLDPDRRHS